MFLDFFQPLREQKIPVSLHEWTTLMRALKDGLVDSDLSRFYFISRALLVKNESLYDEFDQVFLHCFRDAEQRVLPDDQLLDWLERTPLKRFFSKEELAKLEQLSLEADAASLIELAESHPRSSRLPDHSPTPPSGCL